MFDSDADAATGPMGIDDEVGTGKVTIAAKPLFAEMPRPIWPYSSTSASDARPPPSLTRSPHRRGGRRLCQGH